MPAAGLRQLRCDRPSRRGSRCRRVAVGGRHPAGPSRAPRPLRRLDLPQGQARPRRDAGGDRGPRGRGGDRGTHPARSAAGAARVPPQPLPGRWRQAGDLLVRPADRRGGRTRRRRVPSRTPRSTGSAGSTSAEAAGRAHLPSRRRRAGRVHPQHARPSCTGPARSSCSGTATPNRGRGGPATTRCARWTGPAGTQATRLVPLLSAYDLRVVVTSDALRCRQTVEPYAERRSKERPVRVDRTPRLSEDHATRRAVRETVRGLLMGKQRAVVCTHRPVLPWVFEALGLPEVRAGPGGAAGGAPACGPGARIRDREDLSGRRVSAGRGSRPPAPGSAARHARRPRS